MVTPLSEFDELGFGLWTGIHVLAGGVEFFCNPA